MMTAMNFMASRFEGKLPAFAELSDDGRRVHPLLPHGEKVPKGWMRGWHGKLHSILRSRSGCASLRYAPPSSGLTATFSPLGRRGTVEA